MTKNSKFVLRFKIGMSTFLNIQNVSKNFIAFKSYSQNEEQKSLFNTFSKQFSLVNNLPLTYYFFKILILSGLFSRYRYNIFKPNPWKICYTSICRPFYWHIVGIWISSNSMGNFSNNNNCHDFWWKNSKFVLKFKIRMSIF